MSGFGRVTCASRGRIRASSLSVRANSSHWATGSRNPPGPVVVPVDGSGGSDGGGGTAGSGGGAAAASADGLGAAAGSDVGALRCSSMTTTTAASAAANPATTRPRGPSRGGRNRRPSRGRRRGGPSHGGSPPSRTSPSGGSPTRPSSRGQVVLGEPAPRLRVWIPTELPARRVQPGHKGGAEGTRTLTPTLPAWTPTIRPCPRTPIST